MMKSSLFILGSVMLMSCASIIDGTLESDELVTFSSSPSAATIKIGGKLVCNTPCSAYIARKRSDDLSIAKAGYKTVRFKVEKFSSAKPLGNLLLGGVIGGVIDYSSGRGSNMENQVHVTLFVEEK
ncbi:PEGA domain-containing protein [Rhodobacteraceae bacterium]|nr:PEGA domain-containing protein [Paracoccaceae bacterium]